MNDGEKDINKLSLVKLRRQHVVQALVELDENTNRVLNVIKAKYDLKDKGKAIELVVGWFVEEEDDPELKPEFIDKIKRIEKQKGIPVKNFAQRYGLKDYVQPRGKI